MYIYIYIHIVSQYILGCSCYMSIKNCDKSDGKNSIECSSSLRPLSRDAVLIRRGLVEKGTMQIFFRR